MNEWLSGNTINGILSLWETPTNHSKCQQNPLCILNYNVQGWGTRALEAVELIFNSDSSIGIFTEVGELWKDFTIPHFKSFYQKGTNSKGGVVVAVGKHLKATRIDTNIENTVIVDVEGLTEQIRIIGIYWPQCQSRNLEDLTSYISEKTILTGGFNASAQEWQSPVTDARGNQFKKWIEKNNLLFIRGTKNSSKRSDRHIDLIFTNIEDAEAETLNIGTSDHWPIVMKSDRIGFQTDGNFLVVNWTVFQIVLTLLQDFWTKESEIQDAENWYLNYTRFLSALKNRVTNWSNRNRYRPSLPPYIVGMLKQKLKAGSITIADQQEITNMLYSYYKKQANSPTIDESEQHDQKIVRDYNKIMNTLSQPLDIKVEKVTSSEVTKIIKKLKNKKSAGYDQISNYIIKLLPPAYIDCLVKCFNVWLSEGRYPDFWKLAKITTLNKLNAGVPRPDQSRFWQHTRNYLKKYFWKE
ncbi:unnamed protein product [Rotaria socialis]|nr:unnamed protein product [Rotaria socialis]